MKTLEIASNDNTFRYFNYKGKILTRKRDDSTGNYLIFKQHLSKSENQLKNIYGGNGDVSNISASFLLRFPTAKYSDFKKNKSLKDQVLSIFKNVDLTGVVSTFEVDTSAPNQTGLSIYVTVSWERSYVDAEAKSDALIATVTNNTDLMNLFTLSPVSPPFDNVVLDTSLEALTIDMYVLSTIHSLVTTYNSETDDTDIEVKTVGLYDHIGVKINQETDNEYRRLRINGVKTINIAGVDPFEDVIIATLFDKDYKKLYTSTQSPIAYVQETQGTSGDLLNETVYGSITLDLNYDDFTAESQTDFIRTMNSETGGYTIITNVYQGSDVIVEYRVIFDVSKTQQEIDDVVTKLNDDVEIQNIINKSATMNGVVAIKTVNKTTKQEQLLTKKAKIIDVIYDEPNLKIVFKTIGSYKHILYKATEQSTFLSTTNKIVDLPPGFTNKIDVKLVDINDGDITTVKTYNFDITKPIIALNGDAEIMLALGDAYVEQGATVTDDSGETITPVITGAVDVSTVGTYTLTYTATDSSGNTKSIVKTVHVVDPLEAINYDQDHILQTQSAGATGYCGIFTNGDLNKVNASWTINTYSKIIMGLNLPYAVIFKGIVASTKDVLLQFSIGINDLDTWTPTGENTINWGYRTGSAWLDFSNVNGISSAGFSCNSLYSNQHIFTELKKGFYVKLGRYLSGGSTRNFVKIYDINQTLLIDCVSNSEIVIHNKRQAQFHVFAYPDSATFNFLKGVLLDKFSANITIDDWIAEFDPPPPIIIGQLNYDPGFIRFTYKTFGSPPVYTNGNLTIQQWAAITMNSYWLSGQSFSFDSSWTFIFKIKNNFPDSTMQPYININIDPSLANWGSTYHGEADGTIFIYFVYPDTSPYGFTSSIYNVPNLLTELNNEGVYVVITYDTQKYINITMLSVIDESIVVQVKSTNPYTYTNNITPFSVYHNTVSCVLEHGMLYDNTGTATVNDYKNLFSIKDRIPPMITLNGDADITLVVGDAYVEQGATVTDNSGESLSPVITGTVDVNTEGTYTITYTATDSNGNSSSVVRTVNIFVPPSSLIDLIPENFANLGYLTYPPAEFRQDEIYMNRFSTIAYYLSVSSTNYSQPFRIIMRFQHTYISDKYLELNFASYGLGQSTGQYFIILETNPRTWTLNKTNHEPIPDAFYYLNVNRYTVITYRPDGYTDLELLDEEGGIIWQTTLSTIMNWGGNYNYPLMIYVNNHEIRVTGLYSSNNTTITIEQAFA